MFKNYFFLISILLTTFSFSAQNFSGEIVYKIEYAAKNEAFNLDSLKQARSINKSVYLITDGYYRSINYEDQKEIYDYTYNFKDNKRYRSSPSYPVTSVYDAGEVEENEKQLKIVKDSTLQILGYPCYLVRELDPEDDEKVNHLSFYTDSLKVNYTKFSKHETANWNKTLAQLDGALPLKFVNEYEEYIKINTAIKLTPKELKPEDFNYPEENTLVIPFHALDEPADRLPFTSGTINCFKRYMRKNKKLVKKYGEKVYLRFVLMADGSIKHLDALGEDQEPLNDLGIEIFNECGFKFTTGKKDGKPVNVLMGLPLRFKL